MNRYKLFFLLMPFLLISFECGKDTKTDNNKQTQNTKTEFGWKDGISASDIPDFPLKGFLGGKEVQFQYVNFEKWRGSNDNVLVFSLVKPSQKCGFIEDFQGFQLLNKGNSINQGEWVKSKFDEDGKTYQAFFGALAGDKSTANWNCALFIESNDNKTIKGKIALFFNDEKKSWAAGKFEAAICNN